MLLFSSIVLRIEYLTLVLGLPHINLVRAVFSLEREDLGMPIRTI